METILIDLLVEDLVRRLEFGPRILNIDDGLEYTPMKIDLVRRQLGDGDKSFDIEHCRPLLHPITDLVEIIQASGRYCNNILPIEEIAREVSDEKFTNFQNAIVKEYPDGLVAQINCCLDEKGTRYKYFSIPLLDTSKTISYQVSRFLDKFMIDYRGLIGLGLAMNINDFKK
jgi:hypothetical protein